MFIGEIRKILRNKMFLVVAAVLLLIDIMTIIYCLGEKNEAYIAYRNQEQGQYVETYADFIGEMDERGTALLSALDHKEDAYYKKNIDQMISDYRRLSDVKIDKEYNWGVEKYADFTYGIFFCIAFAFVSMEYIYISERKSGMIHVLRTAKKGRSNMILSKWLVFAILLSVFAVVQELLVLIFDTAMYSVGNLNSSVQSLPVFRDCPYYLSMGAAIVCTVINHIGITLVVGSILFFFMTVCNSRLLGSMLPAGFFGFEFFSSQNAPINLFYLWDMKNAIGRYQNINLFGIPTDKNLMAAAIVPAVIILVPLLGAVIFRLRYITELKEYFPFLRAAVRSRLSKLLRFENMYVNEYYKLFILQKKWVLLLLLCAGLLGSYQTYLPDTTYQSAYEAVYHMYLSNIHGRVDEETNAYIEKEKQYIASVEAQIDEAVEKGDGFAAEEVAGELESRKKAFDRLCQQYEMLCADGGTGYMIDELNLNSMIRKYRSDILIFMASSIILVMLLSGLYGAKDDKRTKLLLQTAKNGRTKLLCVKRRCAILCGFGIYLVSMIPSVAGVSAILEADELWQNVDRLYEPRIGWAIPLFLFLVIIYLLRGLCYLILAAWTTYSARKTENEFVTSIFASVVVIVVSLILYFSKNNIPMLLISIANRGA